MRASLLARVWPALLGAGAGAAWGAALARLIFERQPAAAAALAEWPGVLAVAGAGALAGAALGRRLGKRWPALLPLVLGGPAVAAPDTLPLRTLCLVLGAAGLCAALSLDGTPEHTGRAPLPAAPALRDWAAAIVLVGVLLGLYIRTLAPTVGEADAFEFQVSVARLGIAHGNGYPLLILVGKLFESLPLGGAPAWRINASAAAAAALAGLGTLAVARRLGVALGPAWLAAFAFGAGPSLWARATEIEAYALNAALVTALLYLGLGLMEDEESRVIPLLAFIFGLALTNHLTVLMLAPALGFAGMVWLSRLWRAGAPAVLRPLALALLALLLGLSVYLYLPLRWPAVGGGEPFTLERLVYFVRGGEAAAQFDALLPLKEPQRFGYVFRKLAEEYSRVGLALAGLGLLALRLPRGRRRPALFLSLALAGYLYFVLAYNPPEPDFSDFFIAPYAIVAVLMALGLDALSRAPGAGRQWSSAIRYSALALFAWLPLSSIWTNLPRLDLSAGHEREAVGRYTLSQPLAPGAALLADPKRFAAPYYLQVAEGLRPDLEIIVLPDEAAYRAALDERLAAGQSVYLARYLAGLGAGYSLRSVGPVVEVSARPYLARPAVPYALAARLADGLELLGFGLDEAAPGTRYLTLFWRAPRTPAANLAVYLRLKDANGEVAWQSAGAVPVGGLYPTNAWRPGEYVSDSHLLRLPATLPPGVYQLQVGAFPPFEPGAAGWATLTEVPVTAGAAPPEPSRLLRARIGETWLVGYDAPESALPGQRVTVVLYWQRGPAAAVTAFDETRSLAAWPPGAVAPLRYELQTPDAGEVLPLEVRAGRRARCGWLAPEAEACALPPVRLTGMALPAGARNFAGQLVLRRATLETPEVARGQAARVVLEWQGLRAMSESYTVFVHLVGPDGVLYAQKDYWPVEGTRLTSSWQPGEIITDPYSVALPADAPTGAYTVHIGLYLLETLERLPVLNAAGEPLDDKIVLSGLTVR